MEPEDLSFDFIREITDDFSKDCKLGEGAFGVVYKGVTKNGKEVAVKKLKPCCDDLDYKQFQNEFHTLINLSHQNIVQILGYCYETTKKPFIMPNGSKVFVDDIHTALCLEYLHNGSLQKHLSDKSCEVKLDWHMRFKIIKGICEGLKYMHKNPAGPIYHFDLKPDNILLNKEMVPKIADFGLARILGEDTIRTAYGPYGTLGFQPPEYLDEGKISRKFDIFSLGAIMIRILSGPMSYPESSDMHSSYQYIGQVRDIWRNKLQETCSSSDSLLEEYCRQVETCTQIALNCLDKESKKRPNILQIIEKLNGIEVGIGKLANKGCGISFPEMTVHNNIEMRKESKAITVSQQKLNPSCTKLELIDARETAADAVEEIIVGREEEKREILASLLEGPSKKISILPIHGIGGIGKTTLSRLIYNDSKFNGYSKAWVHVSERFDLNKIEDSIVSQLREKESRANDRLTELLHGKKIMIVLDDLWEVDQFKLEKLRKMLYHDDSKIIILATTRSEIVAERICINVQPHKISHLTNDMCWDIIKQRSDFEAREDKEQLMGIGQEIAQKCVGVALAAQSLGFTLRGLNYEQWIRVKESDIWKQHISEDLSLPNQVHASLMLSYSYMDASLKACFTYCAIFPKGHKIVKNDLIYQWNSLGFIEPTPLHSVMDLCKNYIMKLQGLSFLQESSKMSSEANSEKATIFTMHDLGHDLAISLLIGNKLVDDTMGRSRLITPMWMIALRFIDYASTGLSSAAFAPSRSLRVLDLTECSIQKLPHSIRELKELRYLCAPRVQDRIFPDCITKLLHLIFLDLHESNIEIIPESIGELIDLRHLDLSGCKNIRLLPVLFFSLKQLVHLDLSDCSLWLYESLGCLRRLEHLSLSMCRADISLGKVLRGLTKLQYLDISQFSCRKLNYELKGVLIKFTKLRYLDVHGILDTNRVGSLEIASFIDAISSLSSLEHLNLSSNCSLDYIPESIKNLSKLHTLDLSHCFNLKRLPDAISGLDNMKFVNVPDCKEFDKSTVPQNVAVVLPYFVVHDGGVESSSNLCELEYENPKKLEISRLENVKSAEEALRIKLVEKQMILELELMWTRNAERFVDDADVLKQLLPPCTVGQMRLLGYNSASFPSWMMDIATYLPHLVDVTLENMPNCCCLPPLGQLQNLKTLRIGRMDNIRKIGEDLYGGLKQGAFPQLQSFTLLEMKCLEEYGFMELASPRLNDLLIQDCPMLRLKYFSYYISLRSEGIITSGGHFHAFSDALSSGVAPCLYIEGCEAPLHQWRFLRHLPHLRGLRIDNCESIAALPEALGDLTFLENLEIENCGCLKALPEGLGNLTYLKVLAIRNCGGLEALPESLGNLTSLNTLTIRNCGGLKAIPKSIEELAGLHSLESIQIIECCPQLIEWFKSLQDMLMFNIKKTARDKELASEGNQRRNRQEYRTMILRNIFCLP